MRKEPVPCMASAKTQVNSDDLASAPKSPSHIGHDDWLVDTSEVAEKSGSASGKATTITPVMTLSPVANKNSKACLPPHRPPLPSTGLSPMESV